MSAAARAEGGLGEGGFGEGRFEEGGFEEVIVELLTAARRAGLPISAAESIDAQRAVAAVGLRSREDLRQALAATVVKREEDRARFDRVFDGFFRADAGGRRGVGDRLRSEGMGEAELRQLIDRLEAALQAAGAGGGLSGLMQGGAELDRRLEQAMRASGARDMQSPMQVGLYSLRVLEALGVDRTQRALARVRGSLVQEAGEPAARAADALAQQLEALRRRVRARVREDFERRNPERLARSRQSRLELEALAALDRDEVEQVSEQVRRLGQLLRDRLERRRRRSRRGRLDVRRTMRSSLRSGGVPFSLVFRRRRRERPDLIVLCDISGSVRAAARFLLVLVSAMQEAFHRTRSFVFVRDVAETTDLFATHPVEEAVALAFSQQTVNVGASSDYGRSLGRFVDRHLDAVGRRTTVVILGDGRSNYLDPNVEALQAIHRRAARVVWLDPEPRSSWGFGDSEMQRYLPWCTFAASVRSLGELRDAVERLASAIAR